MRLLAPKYFYIGAVSSLIFSGGSTGSSSSCSRSGPVASIDVNRSSSTELSVLSNVKSGGNICFFGSNDTFVSSAAEAVKCVSTIECVVISVAIW